MLNAVLSNWGTIVVLLAVAAIVAAIAVKLIRDRKKGRSACSCGTGCSQCPSHNICHKN